MLWKVTANGPVCVDQWYYLALPPTSGILAPWSYYVTDLNDLQLSPDGSRITIGMFLSRQHKLVSFDVTSTSNNLVDFQEIVLSTEDAGFSGTNSRDKLGSATISFDYVPESNDEYLISREKSSSTPIVDPTYYETFINERSQVINQGVEIVAVDQSGVTPVEDIPDWKQMTQIRRGDDARMYANRGKVAYLHEYTQTSPGNFAINSFMLTCWRTNYGLPLQEFKKSRMSYMVSINSRTTGEKFYEITDHLGNVRVVFSDHKQMETPGGTFSHYSLDIASIADYYPFGSIMPGRNFNAGDYRYGFQGQEKDDEISSISGAHLNFKYRMYDARIARFFAVDPLAAKFPWNSTYAFSENRVIDGIELEGLERVPYDYNLSSEDYESELVTNDAKVFDAAFKAQNIIEDVNNSGRFLGTQMYPMNQPPILYGGPGGSDRGKVDEGKTIFLYDNALKSMDLAISTIIHEFEGHYMERIFDKIPNTSPGSRISQEPNPFYKTNSQEPKFISVWNIISPISTIMEEVNAYTIEKLLHEYNFIHLDERSYQNVLFQLFLHMDALYSRQDGNE
ncbi:hypothetical protein KKG82_05965 [Patescibacteria group bacterium]|nr:hypothetical protein [Patescibacteria group bacterium]